MLIDQILFKTNSCSVPDLFDVREQTGQVYVGQSLLHHIGTYQFEVQAIDRRGTGHKANATVTIIVKPSANSPPVWVIPPLDNMTIHVLEVNFPKILFHTIFQFYFHFT